MPTLSVHTPGGEASGTVTVPAEVFDAAVNVPLMHQVVISQMAAARQGSHDTKTRSEVRGGGRKPFKQKGTGRARQGSIRAPQFTGGGVVHGPTPRSYDKRTPKKMKAAALRAALSDRARHDRVHVLSTLVEADTPSTKAASAALAALLPDFPRNVLVVLDRTDDVGWYSLRNLSHVHLLTPDQLNTYDVLLSDEVVFTAQALEDFLASPAASVTSRNRKLPRDVGIDLGTGLDHDGDLTEEEGPVSGGPAAGGDALVTEPPRTARASDEPASDADQTPNQGSEA